MYSFVTCKSLVIYIQLKKSSEEYCSKLQQKFEFYYLNLNNNLISEISQKGTAYFHIKQLKENACTKKVFDFFLFSCEISWKFYFLHM